MHDKLTFTEWEAEQMAAYIRTTSRVPRDRYMQHYYPISKRQRGECGAWHIGHRKR